MTDQTIISLATLAFLIVSAVAGYLARKLSHLDTKLNGLDDKIDVKSDAITDKLQTLLDAHERRDQERHEDTIQRLTRVETLSLNGHSAPKRKRTLERA